ncbi:MAG: sugar ABC transporter permease [Devosia sp.]|uniref:carbohydrate ABC transporter permease n=1 Tax=Devosia sp. TaxID=1871048 RepID=UPI001A4DB27F|nr:sugar ABC transporter permease [Devosia sp.]MBL8596720.1 sugar ABC transporter permease [Devosia sp.]
MAVTIAIAVIPLIYEVWLSLQDWYMLKRSQPIFGGLINYIAVSKDGALWAGLGRTAIWTVGTVVVEIALALPLALLLNRNTAVARAGSALILIPWVTPFIVLGFGWRFLLDSDVGPIHQILEFIGLAGGRSVLTDPAGALAAITFISGWKGAPFMVIALIAALKSIPDELYEAAEVDGAGAWAQFWHVTVPSIWNTVIIVGLILGILAFYSFDLAWIMTKGGPQDGTAIVGIQIYRAVFLDLRPAYAAAISVVMLLILFAASLAVLRLRRSN